MATMSFGDAMAGFSDVLYARAMEHISDKRSHLLSAPGFQANARSQMTFDVTLGRNGQADVAVSRYCAGFVMRCAAWIESPDPTARVSGSILSSDGGGIEFNDVQMDQRLQFELRTSFWRSTTFKVHLSTMPALPEGTVLKVGMQIDY